MLTTNIFPASDQLCRLYCYKDTAVPLSLIDFNKLILTNCVSDEYHFNHEFWIFLQARKAYMYVPKVQFMRSTILSCDRAVSKTCKQAIRPTKYLSVSLLTAPMIMSPFVANSRLPIFCRMNGHGKCVNIIALKNFQIGLHEAVNIAFWIKMMRCVAVYVWRCALKYTRFVTWWRTGQWRDVLCRIAQSGKAVNSTHNNVPGVL